MVNFKDACGLKVYKKLFYKRCSSSVFMVVCFVVLGGLWFFEKYQSVFKGVDKLGGINDKIIYEVQDVVKVEGDKYFVNVVGVTRSGKDLKFMESLESTISKQDKQYFIVNNEKVKGNNFELKVQTSVVGVEKECINLQ